MTARCSILYLFHWVGSVPLITFFLPINCFIYLAHFSTRSLFSFWLSYTSILCIKEISSLPCIFFFFYFHMLRNFLGTCLRNLTWESKMQRKKVIRFSLLIIIAIIFKSCNWITLIIKKATSLSLSLLRYFTSMNRTHTIFNQKCSGLLFFSTSLFLLFKFPSFELRVLERWENVVKFFLRPRRC